jgi:hypothetical protein
MDKVFGKKGKKPLYRDKQDEQDKSLSCFEIFLS